MERKEGVGVDKRKNMRRISDKSEKKREREEREKKREIKRKILRCKNIHICYE